MISLLYTLYFSQLGQREKPAVEILNAAVFIASSGLKRNSGFGSIFIDLRVDFHVFEEN